MDVCLPCLCVLELAAYYCRDVIPPELPLTLQKEISFIYFNNVTTTCAYFNDFPNLMLVDISKSKNLMCTLPGVEFITFTELNDTQSLPTTPTPDANSVYMYVWSGVCMFLFCVILIATIIFKGPRFYRVPWKRGVYQCGKVTREQETHF